MEIEEVKMCENNIVVNAAPPLTYSEIVIRKSRDNSHRRISSEGITLTPKISSRVKTKLRPSSFKQVD